MRVYSAIQPTGCITIGNYIGAVKNWLALQEENECLFAIANQHALTVKQDPQEFRARTLSFFASSTNIFGISLTYVWLLPMNSTRRSGLVSAAADRSNVETRARETVVFMVVFWKTAFFYSGLSTKTEKMIYVNLMPYCRRGKPLCRAKSLKLKAKSKYQCQ